MSNRYRERKFNSSDNDRLARALPQPVQAWQVNERQKRDQKEKKFTKTKLKGKDLVSCVQWQRCQSVQMGKV